MLPFTANIILISGSYLDISPLSPMPWNVAIQGKYHTDIRKLSRYQSTVSDALKCCHSWQTSYWYQEAIWISVHCLRCLEILPFKANITLISGSYLDISPLSLMPWNVAIHGKHHTDIRKLSGYQSTVSDALKCCHSRRTSHWYQEAIWISFHYLWCLEILPFRHISVPEVGGWGEDGLCFLLKTQSSQVYICYDPHPLHKLIWPQWPWKLDQGHQNLIIY